MPTTDELKQHLEDNHSKRVDLSPLYDVWGDYGPTAKQQGWYPSYVDPTTQKIVFVPDYNKAFNEVVIPNQNGYGRVVIMGDPKKNTLDVQVVDAQGQFKSYIYQNASPATIQNWLTNSGSNVAKVS